MKRIIGRDKGVTSVHTFKLRHFIHHLAVVSPQLTLMIQRHLCHLTQPLGKPKLSSQSHKLQPAPWILTFHPSRQGLLVDLTRKLSVFDKVAPAIVPVPLVRLELAEGVVGVAHVVEGCCAPRAAGCSVGGFIGERWFFEGTGGRMNGPGSGANGRLRERGD